MAAVVRALQIEPLVLLLDEPAACMDAESASRLEELILSWRSSEAGRAFLLTSFVSIMGAAFVVTAVAMTGIIRVEPWFEPQYFIPMLGMVLGNTLNGISLALDRFMEDVVQRQAQVESLLALGASKREAARESLREAARSGMIPIINSMMVMGVVSLPGMMTGQILAGADPVDAVNYQIVIVFMIAAAAALGVMAVTLCAFFSLFNSRHQLRLDRLRRRR